MSRVPNTAEIFWSRVEKGHSSLCWNWRGRVNKSRNPTLAYGRIDIFGEVGVYAHRVAFFLANPNTIPLRKNGDVEVRHTCDNSLCCNPAHLTLGTHYDNMQDCIRRQRRRKVRGEESHRAKLTREDVLEIRRLKADDEMTNEAIAMLFSVSVTTIKSCTSRRHYADVD